MSGHIKGFIDIPSAWLGMGSNIYLSDLHINAQQILMYYMQEVGKYLELIDGRRIRIEAPMAEFEKMLRDAVSDGKYTEEGLALTLMKHLKETREYIAAAGEADTSYLRGREETLKDVLKLLGKEAIE